MRLRSSLISLALLAVLGGFGAWWFQLGPRSEGAPRLAAPRPFQPRSPPSPVQPAASASADAAGDVFPGWVEVRVTRDGAAVSGAAVRFLGGGESDGEWDLTDADGLLAMDVIDGPWTIEARDGADAARVSVEVAVGAELRVELKLVATGTVRVVVETARHLPVPEVTVQVGARAFWTLERTGPSGVAVFERVPAGAIGVSLHDGSVVGQRLDATVSRGAQTEVLFTAVLAVRYHLRFECDGLKLFNPRVTTPRVSARREDLSKATLELFLAPGHYTIDGAADLESGEECVGHLEGEAALGDPPDRALTLHRMHAPSALATSMKYLREKATASLTVRTNPPVTNFGDVTVALVAQSAGKSNTSVELPGDFPFVEPGDYRVEVRTPSGNGNARIHLMEGEHQDLEVTLGGEVRKFTGRVVVAGRPLPDAGVAFYEAPLNSTRPVMGNTDENGHFAIQGVLDGDFIVGASFPGFSPVLQVVTLNGSREFGDLEVLPGEYALVRNEKELLAWTVAVDGIRITRASPHLSLAVGDQILSVEGIDAMLLGDRWLEATIGPIDRPVAVLVRRGGGGQRLLLKRDR